MMRHYLLCFVVASVALPAAARNGQIYLELAPSYGFYYTDDVIVERGDDGEDRGVTPPNGFVPQLKLGINLFGWAGAELDVAAIGWDLDDVERGGGGFVGGVFRLTPLEGLAYVLPSDFEVFSLVPAGPVSWHDRPFDVGIYFGGGAHLIGEDYAYQGGYLKFGIDAKFYITPNFAIGIDLPFRQSLFAPFRYTNYDQKRGLCTEGKDAFGAGGFPVPANFPQRPTAVELDAKTAECDGPAPSGMLFAPALTISGGFDFGI